MGRYDARNLAQRISQKGDSGPILRRHKGRITDINVDGTVDLTLDGGDLVLSGIRVLTGTYLQVNDVVEILIDNTDVFVLGKIRSEVEHGKPAYGIWNRDPNGLGFPVAHNTTVLLAVGNGIESIDMQDAFTFSNSVITIVRPGIYQLEAGIEWSGFSTYERMIRLEVNNVSVVQDTSHARRQAVSRMVALQSNDTARGALYQLSGGEITAQPARETFLSILFVRDLP